MPYPVTDVLVLAGVGDLDCGHFLPSSHQLHVLDHTVQLHLKALGQLGQDGHVAIAEEGVASRELWEIIIVVPVEGRHLEKVGGGAQERGYRGGTGLVRVEGHSILTQPGTLVSYYQNWFIFILQFLCMRYVAMQNFFFPTLNLS